MKTLLKGIGIVIIGCVVSWISKEGAFALVVFPMGGFYIAEGFKEIGKGSECETAIRLSV